MRTSAIFNGARTVAIAVAFDDESNCLPAGPYQPVNGYGHAEIVTERRLQGCEENGDWQY